MVLDVDDRAHIARSTLILQVVAPMLSPVTWALLKLGYVVIACR